MNYKRKVGLTTIFVILGVVTLTIFMQTKKDVGLPECEDELGCIQLSPQQPIKIGVIQDLSSRAAPFGIDQLRSFKIALGKKENKLIGHPVELVIEDSRCLPEYGIIAARKMISDPDIVAILGTTCSNSAMKVMKIVSEAGYTMISGANSANSLTEEAGKPGDNWHPGFFRTMFSTDNSGAAAADFIDSNLKIRKVATIHDGDIYTKGYIDQFVKRFEKLGGEIVLNTVINKGERNMTPVLKAAIATKAELVFAPIFNDEAIPLVKRMREIKQLNEVALMGGNALINDKFINAVGNAGKGMFFLSIAPSDRTPELNQLVQDFQDSFGEPPQSTLFDYGYDAMNVLIYAIEKVAKTDYQGNVQIGRKALRTVLYHTRQFKGITGVLNATEFGDFGIPRFMVVKMEDPEKGAADLKKNIVSTITNKDHLK
jgi:branched-chain amino acid transport system substrate-binding protein